MISIGEFGLPNEIERPFILQLLLHCRVYASHVHGLQAEFCKVEELCTGAAQCQLMDMLYPGKQEIEKYKC